VPSQGVSPFRTNLISPSFCKNRSNIDILLRIDNTTANAYINRMEGGGSNFPIFTLSQKKFGTSVKNMGQTSSLPTLTRQTTLLLMLNPEKAMLKQSTNCLTKPFLTSFLKFDLHRSTSLHPTKTEIMAVSIQDSTLRSYTSALRRWWQFCKLRQVRLFKPSTNNVLNFLSEEFNSGSSFSAVNCSRSAISLLFESSLSNNPMIKRFFKGLARLRPTQPHGTPSACYGFFGASLLRPLFPLTPFPGNSSHYSR